MATLKIHSEIASQDNGGISLFFFGIENNSVSFNSIDEFITSIAPEDNNIDISIHCSDG